MIDKEIKIEKEKLPNLLLKIIEKLEYYDKINDVDNYYYELDVLEVNTKSFVINGRFKEI